MCCVARVAASPPWAAAGQAQPAVPSAPRQLCESPIGSGSLAQGVGAGPHSSGTLASGPQAHRHATTGGGVHAVAPQASEPTCCRGPYSGPSKQGALLLPVACGQPLAYCGLVAYRTMCVPRMLRVVPGPCLSSTRELWEPLRACRVKAEGSTGKQRYGMMGASPGSSICIQRRALFFFSLLLLAVELPGLSSNNKVAPKQNRFAEASCEGAHQPKCSAFPNC